MKIVTAEVIQGLDRRAMAEGGMPGVVLMENAGRAMLSFLSARCGPLRGRRMLVACGTGNNGGDGFVAARLLALAGASLEVALIGDASRIHGDAAVHFGLLSTMGIFPTRTVAPRGGIVIDALMGTGSRGAPRSDMASAIEAINRDAGSVIAMDIPSGIDASTGDAPGAAVRANATVTFGYPKLGLFLKRGPELAGDIVVDPIGFAWESLRPSTPYSWLLAEDMQCLLPARPRSAHKGTFGHVLIVGGSLGMSGAPLMASRAAARTGSGLVTAAVPSSIQQIVAAGMDELMTVAVADRNGAFTEEGAEAILSAAERSDVVCLGPGMRCTEAARALVSRLVAAIDVPVVLDADGLNMLAAEPEMQSARKGAAVLTPHPGEAARLLAITPAEVESDRISAVRALSTKYRCVTVLKGAQTLVCDGRGNDEPPIGINTSGNAGMASGGVGDALTGVIGSLIGQGVDPWDAARLGVFVHARAGDLAAGERSNRGLLARDITEKVPAALSELEREECR